MSKRKTELFKVVKEKEEGRFHFEKDGIIVEENKNSTHHNVNKVKNDKHVLITAGGK